MQLTEPHGLPVLDENNQQQRVVAICWLVAIALGGLYAWNAHYYAVDSDGINYLDMGEAYLRGDWHMAINALWSPFYSWLLGLAMWILTPPPAGELSVVYLVNFLAYVGALGSFQFFLHQLIRYHRDRLAGQAGDHPVIFPTWAWLMLGYTLFVWTSLDLITIWSPSPDMCVAAFVYLASGFILRIRRGFVRWPTCVLLGVVLGFGYLAKAFMFLMAFIFLGISMVSLGNRRRAVLGGLIAWLTFVAISGPFIIALSRAKGFLTFSLAGTLNYAWHVNGTTPFVHWEGEPPGSGTPRHPTRKIFDVPAIYEFGTPIGGTYPAWYDPTYWYDGVLLHGALKEQIRVLVGNISTYAQLSAPLQSSLLVGLLVLVIMDGAPWELMKHLAEQWSLLTPAIAAMGLYALIHVEARYVGPFLVLFWMGLASSIRLADSPGVRRLVACVSMAMLVVPLLTIVASTVGTAHSAVSRTIDEQVLADDLWSALVHRQVAEGLHQLGVQPGDTIATIGSAFSAYWARLARIQIVAELPEDEQGFWDAAPFMHSRIIKAFADTGVKAIVAQTAPGYASTIGWQRLGNTRYYAYLLPAVEESESISSLQE
jgi:hypothetical protein